MFIVKNLEASRVNLTMNDYVAGLPSPLSFLGLADTLVRVLGYRPWSAKCLPVLHQVHVSAGRTKPEMAPDSGVFSPSEMPEDLTGTVKVSLLLDIPECDDDHGVRQAILGKRIAGGVIANRDVEVEHVAPDGSAFRKLSRGYAVLPPSDPDKRGFYTGSFDDLDAFASKVFPAERPVGSGWFIPSAAGYRLLEDPETAPPRARTRRKDVPHVFAEPVAGIAELVSVRSERLTALDQAGLTELLWSWKSRDGLVLGHDAYFPINA
jgi:CRISPR-associated protein (Cas_Csy2).